MTGPEQAKVFISSILNPSLENLLDERKTVRRVVDSYRFLRPWAFESAPASSEALDESYLRNVEECDIFIVIIGREASNPVAAEIQRAKHKNKHILAFAKRVSNRTPTADAILDSVGRKYASFDHCEDLEQAVRDALDLVLFLGLRNRTTSAGADSLLGQLRELNDNKVIFRIQPMTPSFQGEYQFHVDSLDQQSLTVHLHSTRESIAIPVSRVCEILHFGEGQIPILMLNGRLQWFTKIQRWRFLAEKVRDDEAPLGLHKPSRLDDKRAAELSAYFQQRQFQPGWVYEGDVPIKMNAAFQPVYDDDGRYFRIQDRPDNLVLVVQKPGWPTRFA